MLYDVYAGAVPARGIESKTVRECDLSVRGVRQICFVRKTLTRNVEALFAIADDTAGLTTWYARARNHVVDFCVLL